MQRRGGAGAVTDVPHHNHVVGYRVRFGYGGPGSEKFLEGGVLVQQPRTMRDLLTKGGLFVERPHNPGVGLFDFAPFAGQDRAAFAVGFIVAQVAELAGPVNLGRDQIEAGFGVSLAAVNRRFFASLDQGQHIANQVLFVKSS